MGGGKTKNKPETKPKLKNKRQGLLVLVRMRGGLRAERCLSPKAVVSRWGVWWLLSLAPASSLRLHLCHFLKNLLQIDLNILFVLTTCFFFWVSARSRGGGVLAVAMGLEGSSEVRGAPPPWMSPWDRPSQRCSREPAGTRVGLADASAVFRALPGEPRSPSPRRGMKGKDPAASPPQSHERRPASEGLLGSCVP